MKLRRSPGLRTSFLLILLLGAVLPLGIVGWWLTRTTQTSGEELLRSRLEQSLADMVQTVGSNWVDLRSNILALSENEAVRTALAEGRAIDFLPEVAGGEEFESAWAVVEQAVERVVFYDLDGEPRGSLPQGDRSRRSTTTGYASSILPLRLSVYGRGTSGQIGTMEVRLRTSSLLPSDLVLPGLGGSVLTLFDATGRTPLLPITVELDLLERERFSWAGDTWLSVRDTLYEPPLQLSLSAPLGTLGQPFAQAARRGLFALLAVAAAAFLIATLATRRITRPLEQLADGAETVSRGDLEPSVAEQGPDEIRRVAKAFNSMTVSLRETLRELSQRESLAAMGEFAASLAHEVRNPLTAIRLDLERAQKHVDHGSSAKRFVEHALNEVRRLDASVNDGLRLARSGSLTLAPLDLREPLEAAYRVAEPHFQSRGAELEPLSLPNEPVLTNGDPGALEQLLLNLLLNAAEALKAGEHAAVEIRQETGSVCISIRDEGKGITADAMDRIFEPFYSTTPEGTGLGLPIARRIAQAHGGDLEIESAPSEGTVAQVSLPLAAPKDANQA